ncbi:MlaD family protein [Kordiimonas marina]|uniref:MlaD family protein n=1 Tax=Kordiimonas marina TaxID=2872312 RepID=UPI001FF3D430|nr:MlaD family protein [Kordiimonas marina]MCJ9428386.1 MCE family protein [Kordiimonas marina]
METRASYIMVGGFVLTFLAGLIAFAVWIAKVDLDAEYTDYDIYFHGTVSGLYKRSVVYYLGIPVGDVRDIGLAPNDPQKVRVQVRLRSEVPVTEGAKARLDFQGLTGVAYIEINGGPPGGQPIKPVGDQERAVIPSELSPIMEVFTNAPNLVNEAIEAVVQIQKLLDDKNLSHVGHILKNTDKLSANLANGTEDLDKLVADTRTLINKASTTADKLSKLADSGNALIDDDGKQMVAEAVKTLQSAQQAIGRIDALVAANSDNVTDFIGSSLPEITRMIIDLRATARNLSRLSKRIEQNPGAAIFGTPQPQYDLKTRSEKKEKGK